MVFDERLGILRDGNVISPEVESLVRRVIVRLEERWEMVLTEENGSKMVTHLAMALMRILRGEDIPAPQTEIMDEFLVMDVYAKANEILEDLVAWAPMDLPAAERNYMIVYLCLLLDTENDRK